jgi:uncharacterized protein (DUF4415 family)
MKSYVSKGITPEIQANLDRLAAMPDEDIDLSDMPEVTDWSGAVRGKFYRPAQQEVTIQLDADVLQWFKTHADSAHDYLTDISAALRRFVKEEAQKERAA